MGYGFTRTGFFSDNAASLATDVEMAIVAKLKKEEKRKDNQHNTDGILNVAMLLERLNPEGMYSPIAEYLETFIPKFESYVAELSKLEWEDRSNKNQHMIRFKRIQRNLKKILKRVSQGGLQAVSGR